MKVQFLKVEFAEIEVLKESVLAFVNHQKKIIDQTTDESEKYNRFILFGVGRELYFNFGKRIVNNLKEHGKTHCTLSVSIAEAAFLQFVCCFDLTNKNAFTTHVLQRYGRMIDEKIKSII